MLDEKANEMIKDPLARKILLFEEMLTPQVIQLAYWLCLIAVVWNGLGHAFSGGFGNFLEGLVGIVAGAILARVGAELVMQLFKLNERMAQVVENTKPAPKPVTKKRTTKKTSKKVTKKA